jgi:hypothetical protein
MYNQFQGLANWIVEGKSPGGLWLRFGAVVAASFAYGLVMDWKDGELTNLWWVAPAGFSLFVGTAFSLWRIMEHRRREQRRRDKSVTLLDLG